MITPAGRPVNAAPIGPVSRGAGCSPTSRGRVPAERAGVSGLINVRPAPSAVPQPVLDVVVAAVPKLVERTVKDDESPSPWDGCPVKRTADHGDAHRRILAGSPRLDTPPERLNQLDRHGIRRYR